MSNENVIPEREKITDNSDIATEIETNARDTALAEVRARVKPQQLPLGDGTYGQLECDDCGLEIGEARLKVAAMNLLCVHCAAFREKKRVR